MTCYVLFANGMPIGYSFDEDEIIDRQNELIYAQNVETTRNPDHIELEYTIEAVESL